MDEMKNKITNVKNILEKRRLDSWLLNVKEIFRCNIYATKNLELESVLKAKRKNTFVTVYKYFGKEISDSSFFITAFNKDEINRKIDNALLLCNFSRKPLYTLPSKKDCAGFERLRENIKQSDGKIKDINKAYISLLGIYQKIKHELKKYDYIKANSLEIHASFIRNHTANSMGVCLWEEKTSVFVELTVTAFDSKVEQEFIASKAFCRLDDFNIKSFVAETANIAKDILISSMPLHFSGKILLSGYAVSEFFAPLLTLNPLVTHASAKIKYMNLSAYEKNKPIIKERFNGDKITLSANPLLPFNVASSLFDDEGVASKNVCLIDKGIFKEYFASKQYADYLKIKPTGAFGSVQLAAGSKSLKQLYTSKKPIVEIAAFSSFVPNFVSGDFSAEIRLGYLIKDEKKNPFKGGMFTGNVFELIKSCYFSKELKQESAYFGPRSVMFEKGTIAGF